VVMLSSHHVVEVDVPDASSEWIVGDSHFRHFLVWNIVELELVLPKDIEALRKGKHVHHKEEDETLDASENLWDVIH
jgi:hypothetical protein